MQETGLIYKIQRFAIHDGPGIRTLVFMKGCPIRCLWCSSPQTQVAKPEVLHLDTLCKRCGRCAVACPNWAIGVDTTDVEIDRSLCDNCGLCAEACPHGAMEVAGRYATVEEVFREVEKDNPFHRRSNGGVTVGGGEATMQHEFVEALLRKCRSRFIHTAMETCGYAPRENLDVLLKHLDLIYVDVKHMDATRHRALTGVSNRLILDNARLAASCVPTILRIPIVPGCNDAEDNVAATARYGASLGKNLLRVELLPYHKYGSQTYRQLGRDYALTAVEPPSQSKLERLRDLVQSLGVDCQIGG